MEEDNYKENPNTIENNTNSGFGLTSHLAKTINQLLQIYQVDKTASSLKRIDKLLKKYYDEVNSRHPDASYINGKSGLIMMYLNVYCTTKKKHYVDRAINLAHEIDARFLHSPYVGDSLYYGRAGVLLTLFYTYIFTGNTNLVPLIEQYCEKIISNALVLKEGLIWHNPLQFVEHPLISFGQGSTGIGYVFGILSNHLNHKGFQNISDYSFNYAVNIMIKTPHPADVDFRKEMTTLEEYHSIRLQITPKEGDCHKSLRRNYSIENGLCGILIALSMYTKRDWKIDLDIVLKENHTNHFDLLDSCKAEHFIRLVLNKETTGSRLLPALKGVLNANKFEGDRLEIETLFRSVENNTLDSFKIPYLDISKHEELLVPSAKLEQFDWFGILLQENFPRTNAYLEKYVDKEDLKSSQQNINIYKSILHLIEELEGETCLKEVVKDIFDYEKKLIAEKVRNKYHPHRFLKEFDQREKRLNFLNKKEADFLNHQLRLVDGLKFNYVYDFEESLPTTDTLSKKSNFFWRYNLDKGIIEESMNFIHLITQHFIYPARIGNVLTNIITSCEQASEMELEDLLRVTESGNKQNLISRIPEIFSIQVRALVIYGILEPYEVAIPP